MSDLVITLNLNHEEVEYFRNRSYPENNGGLFAKITRAIERAESFHDDDDSGNELVTCAGCNGTGKSTIVTVGSSNDCYFCSGTGKEYV